MEEKEIKKNNSKAYLVIIVILLFIIGGGVVYVISTNKTEPVKTLEEKKDDKEPETNEPEKKELASGILKSNGVKDTANITLNGKTNTLLLENNKKEDGKMLFGNTNIDFIIKYGTGPGTIHDTVEEIEYQVVEGEDGKEYLVVAYGKVDSFQQVLLILNDKTDIIGKYSTHNEDATFFSEHDDCYALFEDFDNAEETMYKVDGNHILFYKYIDGSSKKEDPSTNTIELELLKLEIRDNKVIEVKTGTIVPGEYGQCA